MAAEIFGRGIDDHRRSVIERPHQQRRRGVVHDERHAERPADRRDLGDGEYNQLRIGQGLGVIGARARICGARKILRVGGIDEAHFDALVLERIGEQIPGAAIEIGRGDDVVAGPREVLQTRTPRPPVRSPARGRRRRLRAPRRAAPAHRWSGCRCACRCCRVPSARTDWRRVRRCGTGRTSFGRSAPPPRRWRDRRASRHAARAFPACETPTSWFSLDARPDGAAQAFLSFDKKSQLISRAWLTASTSAVGLPLKRQLPPPPCAASRTGPTNCRRSTRCR